MLYTTHRLIQMTLQHCMSLEFLISLLRVGYRKKLWFELMIYICRRGRENLRDLKQDHFQIYTDSDGREYVAQARDELTKKTREDNRSTRTDGGRMYETRDNNCPVVSFKKYTSKLNPACNAFFQTPKSVAPSTGPWYKKCPVGVNILGTMMPEISKTAKLSRVYTNHCLRATCITILDKTGFASREICQVSGHRNEGSIASYVGRVSDDRKHDMSNSVTVSVLQWAYEVLNIWNLDTFYHDSDWKILCKLHHGISPYNNVKMPLPVSAILTKSQLRLSAESSSNSIVSA